MIFISKNEIFFATNIFNLTGNKFLSTNKILTRAIHVRHESWIRSRSCECVTSLSTLHTLKYVAVHAYRLDSFIKLRMSF